MDQGKWNGERDKLHNNNNNNNNVKAKVILVITGATGTISESPRQYVSNTPKKHEIKKLQKTAILDTAHKLREVKT
jgi:FlaA1/EpsC-like NDP-sugar epimerase